MTVPTWMKDQLDEIQTGKRLKAAKPKTGPKASDLIDWDPIFHRALLKLETLPAPTPAPAPAPTLTPVADADTGDTDTDADSDDATRPLEDWERRDLAQLEAERAAENYTMRTDDLAIRAKWLQKVAALTPFDRVTDPEGKHWYLWSLEAGLRGLKPREKSYEEMFDLVLDWLADPVRFLQCLRFEDAQAAVCEWLDATPDELDEFVFNTEAADRQTKMEEAMTPDERRAYFQEIFQRTEEEDAFKNSLNAVLSD